MGIEGVGVLPYTQVDLLQNVLGDITAANDADDDTEELGGVAA